MSTKAIQGKLWSVAPPYWAKHFEPWFLPMYRNVLDQLKLNYEDVILDAGCGSGMFSHLAAKTGATVTGVDAAAGLLSIARERNPGINFLEEDLESLPFGNESFDVVAGFNSFQYAGSFENALLEAKRVLRKGGRIVMGIWARPELSDATNILKAIGGLLPTPPPGTPGPFALSEDGRIEQTLIRHELKLLSRSVVSCPFLYATLSDAVKSFMGTGPAAAAVNNSDKLTVELTISNAMKNYHVVEDFHFLQNHFLVFVAEK